MNARTCLWIALTLLPVAVQGQTFGVRKRPPRPDEYGRVIMDRYTSAARVAPAVFNHWSHRARYTCRVCHVDLGFAMQAGATGVRESDNRAGLYCGSCHNGRIAFGHAREDRAKGTQAHCARCHGTSREGAEEAYRALAGALPRVPYGDRIDWLEAESTGKLELADSIPGVGRKRRPIRFANEDLFTTGELALPEIVFSHVKHAVWTGCEMCHPDLFAVQLHATRFTMQDIFEGRFCGACHGRVAFPLDYDCRLCHTRDPS